MTFYYWVYESTLEEVSYQYDKYYGIFTEVTTTAMPKLIDYKTFKKQQ